MKKNRYPPYPKFNNPIEIRICGKFKTPSQWARIAEIAEKNNKFGDAYHYWLAGVSSYTRNSKKRKIYQQNSLECLKKWENN